MKPEKKINFTSFDLSALTKSGLVMFPQRSHAKLKQSQHCIFAS